MPESATYYYVIVKVEVNDHDYEFRDEGPGFDNEGHAFEFAREVFRELGHRANVVVSKELTDKFGRFYKTEIEVTA